jgi:hypothetical protein
MPLLFYVTPCKFNRLNYGDLIHSLFDVPPSYAKVIQVDGLDSLSTYLQKYRHVLSTQAHQSIVDNYCQLTGETANFSDLKPYRSIEI